MDLVDWGHGHAGRQWLVVGLRVQQLVQIPYEDLLGVTTGQEHVVLLAVELHGSDHGRMVLERALFLQLLFATVELVDLDGTIVHSTGDILVISGPVEIFELGICGNRVAGLISISA